MESGVATRPLADLEAYRAVARSASSTHSGMVMQPVFAAAAERRPQRVVYAEGEDERVLRAAQVVVDERLARPVLVGRPEVIAAQDQASSACGSRPGRDSRSSSFDDDGYGRPCGRGRTTGSAGAGASTRDCAAAEMRRNGTLIARHAAARGPGRRHAVRHLRPLSPPTCATSPT